MSSSDYHKDFQHISKTMLGHFCKSANDYARYYVTCEVDPPAPKRQMVIGSAVHKILLERTAFDDCVAVYPDSCLKSNGAINPKPAGEFLEENLGKFVMKSNDAEVVRASVDAARLHPLGELLGNDDAIFEKSYRWTDLASQLKCRMQVDISEDVGDYILAYDLKTTEDIYPGAIRRTCKRLRYWLQDAHYSNGLETLFGKPVKFVFWFLEILPPHRIARWEYNPQSRESAQTARAQILDRLSDCYETGVWSDDWTRQTNYLTLDPWEVGADEEGEVAYVGED